RRWVSENVIDRGLARADEIVSSSHCMTPAYLDDQLSQSLSNLGLETIDIYYIHNPETQLEVLSGDEFVRRIRAAFEFLERAASEGRIQFYGTATWNGYRQEPGSRGYLALAGLAQVAADIAGEGHRFRAIQLPHNLAMPEALTLGNQVVDGESLSTLMSSSRLGITVMCSASILQANLPSGLPP